MATVNSVSSGLPGGLMSASRARTHTHNESSLHWAVEKIGGVLFDFSKAIDYATQWVDYSESPLEVKENAGKVKGVVDQVNVFFAGFSAASAVHEALDADDKSFGIREVTGVLSSVAEFVDRLDGIGAINLMEGASPIIAGVGVSADVVGGLYDSAGVLSDGHIGVNDSQGLAQSKRSTLYKLVKIAENVAFVALAALSGYATYCAVFAVAAPVILPFTLLAIGTAALSIKMMRCFYEGLADDGRLQSRQPFGSNESLERLIGEEPGDQLRRTSQDCDPSCGNTSGVQRSMFDKTRAKNRVLETENSSLKLRLAESEGKVQGLMKGLESWSSHKPVHIVNMGNHQMNIDDRGGDEEEDLDIHRYSPPSRQGNDPITKVGE